MRFLSRCVRQLCVFCSGPAWPARHVQHGRRGDRTLGDHGAVQSQRLPDHHHRPGQPWPQPQPQPQPQPRVEVPAQHPARNQQLDRSAQQEQSSDREHIAASEPPVFTTTAHDPHYFYTHNTRHATHNAALGWDSNPPCVLTDDV